MTSPTGVGFTVGGVAAIMAFAGGMIFIKPTVDWMGAIGEQIAASGGPPNDVQVAELQKLAGKLTKIGRFDLVLLTIAVLAMATARFW